MPLNNAFSGVGNVAEYTSAGIPWVTSSTVSSTTSPTRIDFPTITRSILVRNVNASGGDNLEVGFTFNGTRLTNRYTIPPGSSDTFEVRVKEVYLLASASSAAFSVCAALTTIDSKRFAIDLTGSITGVAVWPGVG